MRKKCLVFHSNTFVYNLLFQQKKELIPKVFGHFLPRYEDKVSGYTKVYKIPPRKTDTAKMGIVEFIGNELPPLLPSDEELRNLKLKKLKEMGTKGIPINGTPV